MQVFPCLQNPLPDRCCLDDMLPALQFTYTATRSYDLLRLNLRPVNQIIGI